MKAKETKKTFIQKFQAQLERLDAELELLNKTFVKAKADVRADATAGVDALRDGLAKARRKLGELKTTGDDAWATGRDGLEALWGDVKRSFERLRGNARPVRRPPAKRKGKQAR